MISLLSLPRDVVSQALSFLIDPVDARAVDLVANRALFSANSNGAWKTVALKVFRLRDDLRSWEEGGSCSWRQVIVRHVVPFVLRLKALSDPKHRKGPSFEPLEGIYRRHPTLPNETAAFLGAFFFLGCTGRFERELSKDFVEWSDHSLRFDNKWDEATKDFLYIGSPGLGGGDTQWWMYVVLQGQVTCPRAPENYCDYEARRKMSKTNEHFGPGSIVVFSLWNHGGCEWDSQHVPPAWGDIDGDVHAAFDTVCDEWVRVCVEKPIGASMDALPCAWNSFFEFLDDVQLSYKQYKRIKENCYTQIRK